MAASMEDVETMSGKVDTEFCTIEATVVTGFEEVASEEAKEKFGTTPKFVRGRISVECPINMVEQVTDLGTVDNCRVVMTHVPDFKFTDDQTENLQRLRKFVGEVDWPAGLRIWRKFFSFEHPVKDQPEEPVTDFGEIIIPPPRQRTEGSGQKHKRGKKGKGKKWKKGGSNSNTANNTVAGSNVTSEVVEDANNSNVNVKCHGDNNSSQNADNTKSSDIKVGETTDVVSSNTENVAKKPRVRENPWNPLMPSFRVTCNRSGDKHNFDSMTAASNFGGAIYRYFGWNVKMTEFDIEVILGIEDQEVTVSLGLTKESLHRRNITHFGPTTLRPTIAHGMLRLCEIQPGDIVCDPMCGSGSIPIQSVIGWPYSPHICGDISKKAVRTCADNIADMGDKLRSKNNNWQSIDAFKWNVCNLPLRDGAVDVFLTDLPFGVRVGHKVDNWKLYPAVLFELARVTKPSTGRCCLLTEDKKCMIKSLQHLGKYWTRTKTLGINIGGLAAGVYVLNRTQRLFESADVRDVFAAKGKTENVAPEDQENV